MLKEMIDFIINKHPMQNEDSEEYRELGAKCQATFDEIYSQVNETQQKRLIALDREYFENSGQSKLDGYKEGIERGFKSAIQLIIESLQY